MVTEGLLLDDDCTIVAGDAFDVDSSIVSGSDGDVVVVVFVTTSPVVIVSIVVAARAFSVSSLFSVFPFLFPFLNVARSKESAGNDVESRIRHPQC